MDIQNSFIIIGSIIGVIIIAKLFRISFSKIIKLVVNSILGGLLIFLINQTAPIFGIHIGLNIITSVFIGIFGIPGAILLIVLKFF